MNKRNLGFFRIYFEIVEENPEEVATIFSMLKIVPLKAEYRADWNAYEYLAIGERFEEVPRHSLAPEYEFKISKSHSGNIELIEVIKI